MRGLEGKRVLVSGGSSGIGWATAQRFLEEGSRVVIGGLEAADVESAVQSLSEYGPVSGIAGDISLETSANRLVTGAIEALGGLDVLINNAGVAWREDFLDITAEHWDRMIAVNLRGMFLVAQAVARYFVSRGQSGAITNMASTNGLGGEAEFTHYNASKAGVVLLTKTMAVELGRYGIRVNSVCPGSIITGIIKESPTPGLDTYAHDNFPLQRRGLPAEVAAAYAFLSSDDASYITGIELVIDGGQLAVM